MDKTSASPTRVWAKAILREVPLARLHDYLGALEPGKLANGNGCGNACGNNCVRAIDQLGYTELSHEQLAGVVADANGLKRALAEEIHALAHRL